MQTIVLDNGEIKQRAKIPSVVSWVANLKIQGQERCNVKKVIGQKTLNMRDKMGACHSRVTAELGRRLKRVTRILQAHRLRSGLKVN